MIKIAEKKSVYCQTTALTGRASAVLSDKNKGTINSYKWLNKISDPLLMREYQGAEGFVLIIDESSMISNGYEIFEESEDNEGLLLDKLICFLQIYS